MTCKPAVLNERQSLTFNRFLLGGTGKVLKALESMFEFDIEKSESLIEIAPVAQSESLRAIGDRPLYAVASEFLGDLRGMAHILVNTNDLDHLAEMLRPVMELMFLSRPEADLSVLDQRRPRWMDDADLPPMEDPEFQAQMMDALAEMGNVLVGVYSRSIYEMSARRTMHSLPRVTRHNDRQAICFTLEEACPAHQQRLVIDNQFVIGGRLIHLWCVISLQPESFANLLEAMDAVAPELPLPKRSLAFAQAARA